LVEELAKDSAFFRDSGGGVTFSGGEPLLQADFLLECLARAKGKGFHTAVDTTGDVPYSVIERVMEFTDLFLYDLKAFDSGMHRELTGRGNEQIFENLARLSGTDAQVWVRLPIIPGHNDSEEEARAMAGFLVGLPRKLPIHLLPYHEYGLGKYEGIGITALIQGIAPPTPEHMNRLVEIYRSHDLLASMV
jgi:pyruvate formate lyase activating enzyme